QDPGTHVTVILPRRSYSPLLGRLLHDRTADKIAAVVSRIPRSAATIVPYDVPSRVAVLQSRQAAAKAGKAGKAATPVKAPRPAESVKSLDGQAAIAAELSRQADVVSQHALPDGKPRRHQGQRGPSKGTTPIGSVTTPRKVTVEGKVRVIEIRPVEHNSVLAVEIHDPTGNLTAMFYGRSNIPGLICGSRVRLQGSAGIRDGQPVMINPAYELVSAVEEE
ncbi:MAG: OB-fold nucleic acid binding domain-containing protein, partial [Trebonia sp.]